MQIKTTYIADDGEEFNTQEECFAYEHRFDNAMYAAIFLDDDFNVIPFDLEKVYDQFIYIVIRDAEKAKDLFDAIHDYEWCFVRPETYSNGDFLMWDTEDEWYVNLKQESVKIQAKIDAIEKAVNSLG